jgi:hypothetical protein
MDSSRYDASKKALEEMEASMRKMLDLQVKLEKGLSNYNEIFKEIRTVQKNINYLESKLLEERAKHAKLYSKYEKEIIDLEKKTKSRVKRIREEAEKRLEVIKQELDVQKGITIEVEKRIEREKKYVSTLEGAVKNSNKLKSAWNSLSKLPGIKNWGLDMLKSSGIFEMDKEIRNAARSLGVGQSGFKAFANSISKAADSTVVWGVNAGELAKLQQGYTESIGRSVQLTEEGHKAMALMAQGTGLGADFAVEMASSMDTFGAGVVSSKNMVEKTLKIAGKMGVNSASSAKSLTTQLKLAQRFNFKEGLKNISRMANEAVRLKLDVEGAAGMAEKVFRPEGAVETAALLNTMGGEFSKLGDPFQLMFKARNDFEGFTKDLGKASSEFIKYDKATGTFINKSGLAADRMREISTITGISVEKLQEMGAAQKKIETIEELVGGKFSKEQIKLISSIAQFGEDGKITIKQGGFTKDLKNLQAGDFAKIKLEEQNLEKRAELNRTFLEVVDDLKASFVQSFLPMARELKDNLGIPIQNLIKEWKANGLYDRIRNFAEGAGKLAAGLGLWVVKAMEILGPDGTLIAYFGGKLLFNAAKWLVNGFTLARGFLAGTRGFGGAASGGGVQNLKGVGGLATTLGAAAGGIGGNFLADKTLQATGTQQNMGGDIGGLIGGIAGSLLPMPILGTAIGSYAGKLIGNYIGSMNDGIINPNSKNSRNQINANPNIGYNTLMNDGIIKLGNGEQYGKFGNNSVKFHENDKFTRLDDGMIAASTSVGQLSKLSSSVNTNKTSSKSSKVTHEHKYSGEIKLIMDNTEIGRIAAKEIIKNPKELNNFIINNNMGQATMNNGGITPAKKHR